MNDDHLHIHREGNPTMTDQPTSLPAPASPSRWQPLGKIDRRVAGVLVEKAKTTPSAYPMSLAAIVTAANQKSNRFPAMQLGPDEVEESLERLRNVGAVGMIEGTGRVERFRHYLYEWLGVDKVELAVMAELLLRGPQTEGELRGRAARMEPIADLGALRPVLTALKARGLVIPLTPEGRGHVVTHGLYPARELENLQAQFTGGGVGIMAPSDEAEPAAGIAAAPGTGKPQAAGPVAQEIEALRHQVEGLQSQVAQLRSDLDDLAATCRQTEADCRRLREELGA
ncbi:MAG: DUF480 domain-containing protein [Thermoguttaceae bacterium]|jgi:hypothetical protein